MKRSAPSLRKSSWPIAALLAGSAVIAAACSSSGTGHSAGSVNSSTTTQAAGGALNAVYQLKLGSDNPTGVLGAQADQFFIQEVESLTNNHVMITLYPNGALGTDAAMLTQEQNGALDITDLSTSAITGSVPVFELYSLPFLLTSPTQVATLFNSNVTNQVFDAAKHDGITGVSLSTNGAFDLLSSKPVRTPADMKGLRVRVVGDQLTSSLISALGATPVPLPATQAYSALQQGVVNAAVASPAGFIAQKWYQVITNMTQLNYQWAVEAMTVSTQSLARLPTQYRNDLLEAGRLTTTHTEGLTQSAFDAAIAKAEVLGVKNVPADQASFAAIGKSLWQNYEGSIGANIVTSAEQVLGQG